MRLGRSIATVRRLEKAGTLTPALGLKKVRLFRAEEVEKLAERARQTGRTLSGPYARGHLIGAALEPGCVASEERLNELHDENRTRLAEAVVELLKVVRPRNARAMELAEEILDILAERGSPT
jgi:hypothetical protein